MWEDLKGRALEFKFEENREEVDTREYLGMIVSKNGKVVEDVMRRQKRVKVL